MSAFKPNVDVTKSVTKNRSVRFCSYCGTSLDEGDRFCKSCGETILGVDHSVPETEAILRTSREESLVEYSTERKTVYEGNLHKCPNCGETLQSFVVNCPTCDYELRNTEKSIPKKTCLSFWCWLPQTFV
jgi:predicted amidophosphoribosyltransferase